MNMANAGKVFFLVSLKRMSALLLAGVMTFCSGLVAAQEVLSADGQTAEEAVRSYIDDLVVKLQDIQPLFETDKEAYFSEIGDALDSFIDFREVARGVMAKYSVGPNGATPEQLDRFAVVFKQSVIDFYGTALAAYGGQAFEYLDNRSTSRDPARSSNVRMMVTGEEGRRFELVYTMFLDDDQQWRMKNLYVEGVNLRRQYHSQFDSLMSRYDFDIDAVIDNWSAEIQ